MNEQERQSLISIGKMAEMNHISVPTLRLYDNMGLLRARYTDPETGYRYYDIGQNSRLDFIACMKELGMSLADIRQILEEENLELIEEKLAEMNEKIHEQMRILKIRHDSVQRSIASIERYRKSPVTGTISLEYIDQRYIWAIHCGRNFYDGTIADYEAAIQMLRSRLMAVKMPLIHSYNLGTSICKEDYLAGNYVAQDVFIFGDKQLKEYEGRVETLDSGMYACIYLEDYDEEMIYGKRLLDFCLEHNYQIAGNYICEEMTEFNVFDSGKRNMFLRLQVPVTFRTNR